MSQGFSSSLGVLALVAAAALLAACQKTADEHAAAASTAPVVASAPAAVASAPVTAPFEIAGALPDTLSDREKAAEVVIYTLPHKHDDTPPLASAKGENGAFKLEGTVGAPTRMRVEIKPIQQVMDVIVEGNSSYKIAPAQDGFDIVGGTLNEQVYGYRRTPEFDQLAKAQETARRALPKEGKPTKPQAQAYNAASDKLEAYVADEQNKVLTGDAPALVKLYVLADNHDDKRWPADKRLALLDTLEKDLPGDERIARLRQRINDMQSLKANAKSMEAGKPYQDVTVKDMDGKPVKLSEALAKNKLVLLDFWASWCSPCRAEFPHLRKVYEQSHAKGFEIFSVSVDDDMKEWKKALDEEKPKWLVYHAEGAWQSDAAKGYGVTGIPSNVLISSAGSIVARDVHGDALDQAIAKHL